MSISQTLIITDKAYKLDALEIARKSAKVEQKSLNGAADIIKKMIKKEKDNEH